MITIKNLLITTSMASLLLFGCTNNTTNSEEYTPGPEDVTEEQVEIEEIEDEETSLNVIDSKLVAFSNKDVEHNYYQEYYGSHLDMDSIHNNISESDIVNGDNESLLQLMFDIEEYMNKTLSSNPIVIGESDVMSEVSLIKEKSKIESFEDTLGDANLINNIQMPFANAIFIVDKRIDKIVTEEPDPLVGTSNVNIVDAIHENKDAHIGSDDLSKETQIMKIVYENENYLIAVQPELQLYKIHPNESDIQRYFEMFESDNMQEIFEKHLSN